MTDDKKLNVIIHRGTAQIGGICTEVAADNTRIFFDFGLPLEGEGDQNAEDYGGSERKGNGGKGEGACMEDACQHPVANY